MGHEEKYIDEEGQKGDEQCRKEEDEEGKEVSCGVGW